MFTVLYTKWSWVKIRWYLLQLQRLHCKDESKSNQTDQLSGNQIKNSDQQLCKLLIINNIHINDNVIMNHIMMNKWKQNLNCSRGDDGHMFNAAYSSLCKKNYNHKNRLLSGLRSRFQYNSLYFISIGLCQNYALMKLAFH